MHYLFLVRHYPPEISGGARRPFLLVRALRRIGYKITLVTPFNVEDDPDHICVIGSASNAISDISSNKSTFNIFSNFKNVMRIWFLWPDADILWAKRVERAVIKSGITPDGIFTTSPSESIHIVGSRLAKRLNVHWVAEFRDTWFHNPHRKILERSMLRRFVERLIARRALKYVSGLTAVSRYVMNDILTFAPVSVPHKIIGHFSEEQKEKYILPSTDVNIVHSGGFTLSDRRRHLFPLLNIFEKTSLIRPKLHLHIAGRLTKDEKSLIDNSSAKITYHGQISLTKSQAMQSAADGLVLYTPEESHALPGKYVEYCLARRPILYLGGGDWMNLLENPENLRSLRKGLIELKKGEYVQNESCLSADKAAELLNIFFKKIQK